MKDKTLYTSDSIKSLESREHIRLRAGLYLGSNEYSTQLVKEIFYNSHDEVTIGHGSLIKVSIDTQDNIYSIEDEGQGIPVNLVKENNKTVLQKVFDTINTSGKFDSDGVYQGTATGLNGIGSKLTNFLSNWLEVSSWQGYKMERIKFKDGIFQSREVVTDPTNKHGMLVKWQPDPQFFQNPAANVSDLRKLFQDMSALSPGLKIELNIDNQTETFYSPEGLRVLLDMKCKDKELLSNRFAIRKETENGMLDVALTYNSDYTDNVVAYVNYGLTESGKHIAALRTLLTEQINRYAQDNELLGKKESKLTSAELSEGQVLVFNVKSRDVKYDSQTKVRVVDLDTSIMQQVIRGDFAAWLINNPKDAKLIIDRALTARKAQNAKDKIRGVKQKGKKFISLPTKLVDAWSKDRTECELHITEGDSAANGIIAKRDGKTQAVFPIRGKILSCRKAPLEKIYANQEIANIVKALGLDIEKDTGKLIYNVKKLRYNKIIFQTDADPDGAQIRLLLLNAFWWLCPELVENGHIYVGVPPLFRITDKKNNYIYLKDQAALDDYKNKHQKDVYTISRLKGLGEMSPDELAYCLINPNTRQVVQIESEDFSETDNMLEMAMGNDVKIRRDYLLAHY